MSTKNYPTWLSLKVINFQVRLPCYPGCQPLCITVNLLLIRAVHGALVICSVTHISRREELNMAGDERELRERGREMVCLLRALVDCSEKQDNPKSALWNGRRAKQRWDQFPLCIQIHTDLYPHQSELKDLQLFPQLPPIARFRFLRSHFLQWVRQRERSLYFNLN